MNRDRPRRSRLLLTLILLTGGTAFTSCQGRLQQAVTDGTQDFVLSLLDPRLYLSDDSGDDTAVNGAGGLFSIP